MNDDPTRNKRQQDFRYRKEKDGLKYCGGYIKETSIKLLKEIKEGMREGLKTSNAEAIEWAISHTSPGLEYHEDRLKKLNSDIELIKIELQKRLLDALRKQASSGVELTVPSISKALDGIHISKEDLMDLSLIDKIQ